MGTSWLDCSRLTWPEVRVATLSNNRTRATLYAGQHPWRYALTHSMAVFLLGARCRQLQSSWRRVCAQSEEPDGLASAVGAVCTGRPRALAHKGGCAQHQLPGSRSLPDDCLKLMRHSYRIPDIQHSAAAQAERICWGQCVEMPTPVRLS